MLMSDAQMMQSMVYFGVAETDPADPNWANGLSWRMPRDGNLFADLLQTNAALLAEVAPKADELPEQCTASNVLPCDPRWTAAWTDASATLKRSLDSLDARRQAGGNGMRI
jgi:hypothetical protein